MTGTPASEAPMFQTPVMMHMKHMNRCYCDAIAGRAHGGGTVLRVLSRGEEPGDLRRLPQLCRALQLCVHLPAPRGPGVHAPGAHLPKPEPRPAAPPPVRLVRGVDATASHPTAPAPASPGALYLQSSNELLAIPRRVY